MKATLAVAVLLLAATASATIYLNEDFASMDKWVNSEKKTDYGKFVLSSGDFFGDEKINQGLKTSQDAKFYSASRALESEATNEGKDFVVSLSVKHEQGLDCGGGYIKLMPAMDAKAFDGDSEYFMMFGPDKCGATNRVHLIFNYKGENLLWKKQPRFPDDKFTHVYTVVVKPDNTYVLYIDQEEKESGSLEEDWSFLKPKEIDDPSDKKPATWVDEAQIADAEDKKPEDWDVEAAEIQDPEAKKPEDWDDEEDGEWEAPMVPNPAYKGEWKPKMIPNPEYKGEWKPKQIANPAYEADAELYKIRKPVSQVGIDVWQVKSGSIFDNIVVGDSLEEVNKIVDATFGATKEAEKKAEEEAKKATEEAAKKATPEEDADEDKEDL